LTGGPSHRIDHKQSMCKVRTPVTSVFAAKPLPAFNPVRLRTHHNSRQASPLPPKCQASSPPRSTECAMPLEDRPLLAHNGVHISGIAQCSRPGRWRHGPRARRARRCGGGSSRRSHDH
jgi:hypothetical protein